MIMNGDTSERMRRAARRKGTSSGKKRELGREATKKGIASVHKKRKRVGRL